MDLSYLISISDGDQAFIQDFVETFERSTLPQIADLKATLISGKFDAVKKMAHQLKPTTELLQFENHKLVLRLHAHPDSALPSEVDLLYKEAEEAIVTIRSQFGI